MAQGAAVTERKSFCRTCNTHCGMVVTVDAEERIVGIKPDREDLMTAGFACFKGLQAHEAHAPENRVMRPLKRRPDGSFEEISLERAVDEIAERLSAIIDRDGPESVGGYRGSGAGLNGGSCFLLDGLFKAIGTPKVFSALTIDQSAKIVAAERIGTWAPGPHPFVGSDVTLIFGANPLVSYTSKFGAQNPLKNLKDEIAKGKLKVLVVDPRRSETARFADIHIRPMPGEDATIAAGMIRLVLDQGWEDKAFVAAHVADIAALRAAVDPFTPEYVARRADVPLDDFVEMTRIFAQSTRGRAQSGTGGNMGPHSNLVEHLLVSLNIVCGRYVREGERIGNPGVLMPRYPRRCQVTPARRSYDGGYKSRVGDFGLLDGGMPELPTGIMSDEILEPGPGQVKAFFVHGGNPAVIVPDQLKVVRAFRSLDLLVTIDPYMTPTAQLSDYVIPTLLPYERPDLPCWQAENIYYQKPFTRYTPAVARPPAGSEIAEDVHFFWALAKRMGLELSFLNIPFDMDRRPDTDDVLRIVVERAGLSFEELRQLPLGGFFEGEPQYAEPAVEGWEGRFDLAPGDIVAEIDALAREDFLGEIVVADGAVATHRLSVRRQRHMWNSVGLKYPNTHRRVPHNTAMMNPADLAALGVEDGDILRVTSAAASVEIIAEADETLRSGVLSMVHGYGLLPDEGDYRRDGVCVNILLSTDQNLQTVNAMPLMTAVPVAVERVGQAERSAA